ncbi:Aspartyl-tRNA(Asn) amidotransferase subunit A [Planctomycetales bacterium 10988]|nr:Aspartyl-tRNA(Asn) amidotransferase subunit A [Planctomycetales bacterium 10988]
MSSWIDLSANELLSQLEAGQVTSQEVVTAFLDRIHQVDPKVHAFLNLFAEEALQKASVVDERRKNGEKVGLLGGLPVAVKDVLCMKIGATTAGSKMLERFHSPYNATVIEKLEQADGIILGKTNMDEFAMGSSTENSAYNGTANPWDLERVPGGSSGGAAACVASQMAPLSLGTDTGGSIRQPAAFCGITGVKPTYGRVSRFGMIAFASSLDQIGPMTNSVEDAALLLEVIAGHDPSDATSLDRPVPNYREALKEPLKSFKLGLPKEIADFNPDPEIQKAVEAALEVYRETGATIEEISLPNLKYAVPTYYVIAPSEASSNLARYDSVHYGYRTDRKAMMAGLEEGDSPLVQMYSQSRAEGFGPEVKRRIMLGTFALSKGYYDAYYLKALKVRRLIRQDFDRAFEQVDAIIGPCTPKPAFKIGEKVSDPISMYLEDLFTVGANLSGNAAMSIPCGFTSENLPIGLQLQVPALEEERLFRIGHLYQQVTDWHQRRPSLG